MILHQFRNVFTDVHRCWPAWACAPWPRKQESSFFQSTYTYLKKRIHFKKTLWISAYVTVQIDIVSNQEVQCDQRLGAAPPSFFSATVLILKQRLVLPVFVYSFLKKGLFSVYCWVSDSLAEHCVLETHSRCEVVYRFREWLHHRLFLRLLLLDMWVIPRLGLLQIVNIRWTHENMS